MQIAKNLQHSGQQQQQIQLPSQPQQSKPKTKRTSATKRRSDQAKGANQQQQQQNESDPNSLSSVGNEHTRANSAISMSDYLNSDTLSSQHSFDSQSSNMVYLFFTYFKLNLDRILIFFHLYFNLHRIQHDCQVRLIVY